MNIAIFSDPTNGLKINQTESRLSALCNGIEVEVEVGILRNRPHLELIEKINQLGQETIQAVHNSSGKLWVFTCVPTAAPWIKRADEKVKKGKLDEALKCLKEAQTQQLGKGANLGEINEALLNVESKLLFDCIGKLQEEYLSSNEQKECKKIQIAYPSIDKLVEYLNHVGNLQPEHHFLCFLVYTIQKNPILAAYHSLFLIEKRTNPIPAISRAVNLLKNNNNPLLLAQFLERVDRDHFIGSEELKTLLDQKDTIRMYFEKELKSLKKTKPPTCFLCYNPLEKDLENWLAHTLVPDLFMAGVEPIISLRDLTPGKEKQRFETQASKADYAILICTPGLKQEYEQNQTNPTGAASQIRLAITRFQDKTKHETHFPLYLKGENSPPDVHFQPNVSVDLNDPPFFRYYEKAFELFGALLAIHPDQSRKIGERFSCSVEQVLKGNLKLSELQEWRKELEQRKSLPFQTLHMGETIHSIEKHTPSICLLKAIHPHFIGREKQLEAISQNLQKQRKVILYGPAGVGKSELATKYINDHLDEYSLIWTLSCSSETSKELSYRRLAEAMNLYIVEKETLEDLIWKTHQKLEQNQGKPWLLFYDDMNEPIPLPGRGGDLIITSYKKDPSSLGVPVNPLSTEEAKTFISKITGEPPSEEMEDLIELTGSYPLILGRVATYISRLPDGNIKTYLKDFPDREDFLKLPPEERYQKTFNEAVEQTLKILPEKAKAWILASSYLHPKAIPISYMKKWLQRTYNEEGKTHQQTVNEVLIALSEHVLQQKQGKQLTSHPLFQDTLKLVETGEYATSICDLLLNQANWDFEYKNNYKKDFAKAVEWYQQAKAFTKHHRFIEINAKDRGRIFFFLGRVAYETLKFEKAIEYLTQSLEIREEVHGKKHSLVATSLNNIGNCYESQGKYEKALNSHKQSLEIKEDVHGKRHTSVAKSLNNIGCCYYSQEKYEEALQSHKQSLKIREKVHGKKHPDVATSLNNIGCCYYSQKNYKEALQSHNQSLKIREKVHGKKHPDVATSLNNIGCCYYSQENYKEALKSHEQSLKIREKVHGKKHPDVATSLNNIGCCYYSQKNYKEALQSHNQSLKIREKVHGKKHPLVAMSLNNIGSCHYSQEKYEEALKSHKQSLKIRVEVLGKKHPLVAMSLSNIGSCYESQGKYEEAKEFYKKAKEIKNETYD